ncbi:TIR domain-containing protein [Sphingomonas solaris]|uniref:TIR-like domain-containing protein n=1 Tax=Alterirhizorhabdus solaris TaxID=2529389 RepID=A0A558RCI2_9SPHN|nr:TIR domain-containing protein [Sphingomonas solaris]TVV76952.1 TIR-like domain-containing protein [Sphingomonas solaris]
MARHTFFSFHHQRDAWRAGQVRNSWVTQDRIDSGFWDAAAWEEVKRRDKATIHKWIDEQMKGTSVTVVLIGAETSTREHVGYEISQSHTLGKGMLGVNIHNIKNEDGLTDKKGANPFSNWSITQNGQKVSLATLYPTYDWVSDNGRANMGAWIEAAAKKAGR